MAGALQVNITSENNTARVDIIGSISEWNRNNAADFRQKCQESKDAGATSCYVYLMTTGGDCFQANEIVNILNDVFKGYTGEGGAIVASAGTYIAVNATAFTLAKNGQFMIHKPSGWTDGNETEIENYLKLLRNMTSTYYDAYLKKLKKPGSEFKAKWDAGDFWMTAQEAKDWGFISDIKEPVKIDDHTAQAIRACGSPIQVTITNYSNKDENMSLEATATALGLPKDATQEQINAKIAENARKVKDFEAFEARQKTEKILAELDKAEKEHRIKATSRTKWEEKFNADFEGTKALLDDIEPVVSLSKNLKNGAAAGTYQGKTFEQLQDEDPDLLAELQDEQPDTYEALFADWKKRNKIK